MISKTENYRRHSEDVRANGDQNRINAFWFCFLLLVAALNLLFEPLHPDSAVHFHLARLMMEGGAAYESFMEVNPPLYAWLATPALLLADLTGANEVWAFRFVVLIILALSCLCSRAAFRDFRLGKGWSSGLLLLILYCPLIIGPTISFGQRDHFSAILLIPWIVQLVSRSQTSRQDFPPYAIFIGLCVGLAISMKPHYLILWGLSEVYLAVSVRDWRRFFCWQNWTVVAIGLVYLAAIMVFQPAFFSELLPVAAQYYGAYRNPVPLDQVIALLAVLAVLIILVRTVPADQAPGRLARCLVMISALALVVFWMQSGFLYQAILFFSLASSAVGIVALFWWKRISLKIPEMGGRWFRLYGALLVMIVFGSLSGLSVEKLKTAPSCLYENCWQERYPWIQQLAAVVQNSDQSGNFGTLGIDVAVSFPTGSYSGTEYAFPYPALWPIPGMLEDDFVSDDELAILARPLTTSLGQPGLDIVLVDVMNTRGFLVNRKGTDIVVDYVGLFSRDSDFAMAWRAFDEAGVIKLGVGRCVRVFARGAARRALVASRENLGMFPASQMAEKGCPVMNFGSGKPILQS